jgi:telomere length regulation protein
MMAKKIALAFSLVIDQKNPLLLDETDKIEDLCDWETCDMRMKAGSIEGQHLEQDATLNNKISETKVKKATDNAMKKKKKYEPVSEAFDPDEVIDLRTYTSHIDDNDDDSFGGSDSESVCSIQPYSLSDDESDLQREKFPMQLNDCCVNLRKGDQPELVGSFPSNLCGIKKFSFMGNIIS